MATNHPSAAQIAQGKAEGDLGRPRVIWAKSLEGWPIFREGNIPQVKYRPTHPPPLDPAEREGFMNNTAIRPQIALKSHFEP